MDLIKPKDAVAARIDAYTSVLNSTIPFVIDDRLVGPGLAEARSIIRHLPIELRKLLKKVNAVSQEFAQFETFDEDYDTNDDTMGLSPEQLTPDAVHMGTQIGETPVHGRAVRNILWVKRDPLDKPLSLYAAGLSFEPRNTAVDALEGVSVLCSAAIPMFLSPSVRTSMAKSAQY